MKNVDLTPLEEQILQRSPDLAATRRRRTAVLTAGVAAAVLLAGVAWLTESWRLVLVASLAYVTVTLVEKVCYANAVLAYKTLIQKLRARVEELEGGRSSP